MLLQLIWPVNNYYLTVINLLLNFVASLIYLYAIVYMVIAFFASMNKEIFKWALKVIIVLVIHLALLIYQNMVTGFSIKF
ncbi:MAG: hypothetical protein ACOXZZ_02495 [Sphaerochaetaceae bacterium]